ncbi:MAG: hypothetical protein JJT89_04630 [Nitriliruptoraceae bacterium]|nr:hypothetical protein [Nitriliruptoraceae bacterium]
MVVFLITRTPSPTVWPLLIAAAGALALHLGFSPGHTLLSISAGLLFGTAGINHVAAVNALRRARRDDPQGAFERVAADLRDRLATRTGTPLLATLLGAVVVGAVLVWAGIGGNTGITLMAIGATTFGTWCVRLVERSSGHPIEV